MNVWTSFNAYVENKAITKVCPMKTKGRMYNFIKVGSILFWSVKLPLCLSYAAMGQSSCD